jgi:hypothetical protein
MLLLQWSGRTTSFPAFRKTEHQRLVPLSLADLSRRDAEVASRTPSPSIHRHLALRSTSRARTGDEDERVGAIARGTTSSMLACSKSPVRVADANNRTILGRWHLSAEVCRG